jgi:hypothetical protein
MKTVNCRSCGAQMIFARTKKGAMMPLDATPVADGKYVIIEQEDGLWALSAGEDFAGERYNSHYKTCLTPARFSKKKKRK